MAALGPGADKAQGAEPVVAGNDDVAQDAELGEEALRPPVLRHHTEARPDILCHAAAHGLPVQGDGALVILDGSVDAAHKLRSAGTHQAADTQDLSAIGLEAYIVEQIAQAQILHFDAVIMVHIGDAHPGLLQLMADHHGGDGVRLNGPGIHHAHHFAVAHDGEPVRDPVDLLQPVGDIEDAGALFPEALHGDEELLRLAGGEGGSGLVHDEELGLRGEGLQDLAHLPLGHAHGGHHLVGAEEEAVAVDERLHLAAHLLFVGEAPLHNLVAQEDVFRDGQLRHQAELLIDDGDARLGCVVPVVDDDVLPVDVDLPVVLGVDAGDDFDDGAFPRAVLAHEGVDLSLADLQVDVFQHLDAVEGFADVLRPQDQFFAHCAPPPF